MAYFWSRKAKRYRTADGRFIAPTEIDGALNGLVKVSQSRLESLVVALQSGQMSLPDFALNARQEIKAVNLLAAGLGAGGKKQLLDSPKQLGRYGAELKKQLIYFQNLIAEIESGAQPLSASLVRRLKMYGAEARSMYFYFHTQTLKDLGTTVVRRILMPAEHCPGCLQSAGTYPIDSVPPIGSQQCLTNCKCLIIPLD